VKRVILVVWLICLLFVTACSGGGASEKVGSVSNDPKDLKPTTLRFAIWDENQKKATDAIIAKFNEKFPQIKVDVEVVAPVDQYLLKLETSATGKSAPDVFWMTIPYLQKYAKNGILEPLDSRMARDKYSLDSIYENIVQAFSDGGKIYGIPKDYDTMGLWYNKTMFDKAGIPYPDDTWDWNKLVEVGKKLNDPSKGVWGFAAQVGDRASYYNTIPQNGGQIITKEGKSGYDSPEVIQAVKYWVDFIHVHKISPTLQQMTDTTALNMFKTGKVAMYIDGSWRASELVKDKYTLENTNVAVLPRGKQRATSGNSVAYSMYSESKNKEQAWELLKFLGSREAAEILATFGAVIPAHKGSEKAWVNSIPQFNLQVFVDMAQYVSTTPASLETAKWRSEATKQFQRAWAGEISVEEAAKLVAAQMNSVLASEKK
jgi:multiple sugar transport system substrate-binding protein